MDQMLRFFYYLHLCIFHLSFNTEKQSRGKSLLFCRSLRSKEKQIALLTLIDTHQPHIINANGTFHSPDINSSELGLHNFEVFRDGWNCHEGGVLIVVKNILLTNKEKHLKQENLESVWFKV